MHLEPAFVGMELYDEEGSYGIEYCVDITDQLPPDRDRRQKGPHYLAFMQSASGTWIVEIIFGRLNRGMLRCSLAEASLQPRFTHSAIHQLQNSGINSDQFTSIVLKACALVHLR